MGRDPDSNFLPLLDVVFGVAAFVATTAFDLLTLFVLFALVVRGPPCGSPLSMRRRAGRTSGDGAGRRGEWTVLIRGGPCGLLASRE